MKRLNVIAIAVFVFFSLFAVQNLIAGGETNKGAKSDAKAMSESKSKDDQQARSRTAPMAPMKVSTMTGATVKNYEGQQLGTVEDLVVGRDNRIQYMILSHGGTLGIGDRLFAVPWDAVKPANEPNTFVLNIDRERLANAPQFDRNTWPNFADPNVYNLNYGYYMSDSGKDQAKGRQESTRGSGETRSEDKSQ
jgi:sporulation protein YlmC with PRC-barrel domain